ncbi:hypothetical protein [Rhizobium sp. L1K21]|uniref:alpha/beta hydrolase family protein n=1 Tax=Rhizobium sp. L1K21 TaxID=2954933 RepID=UPI0020934F6C|nr:hypothetical protein [Rhizobium sp. L1K21]MCO6185568.1 hypothetical protein [Rhizobium sp. L1K21]
MYFCGYLTGAVADETRTNWDGNGPRPITWSAWFPTHAEPNDANRAKDGRRIFLLGDIVEGASLSGDKPQWPVVMLSHGTAGSAEELGWMGRELARRGFIAIAPNHHGNTAHETFREEGFICWWERAVDLSELLTQLSAEGPFAGRLDLSQVTAAGFSIGGYTALVLGGARTSVERFYAWRATTDKAGGSGMVFSNLEARIPELLVTSAAFRAAYERQDRDLSDARFASIFAMAPAPPVRGFSEDSVAAFSVPVHLVTSDADTIAPRAECADWLKVVNPAFKLSSVGEAVGHFSYLGLGSPVGKRLSPRVFADNEGVDRAAVHARILDVMFVDLGAFKEAPAENVSGRR